MSTISDVAKKSGVSTATVSHILNGTRYVSPEVQKRVLQVIDELGYQPNSLARSLRMKETHTLGLILPDSINLYFAEIQNGAERAAVDQGYTVILCNTEGDPEKEKRYVSVLRSKRVDGILFISAGPRSQLEIDETYPMVLVDRDLPGNKVDLVTSDNYEGGYMATHHLVSLGHRRIACITGPDEIVSSGRRISGYRQAMKEAGLPFDPQLVEAGDFHPASGRAVTEKLLRLPDPPTAIFAFNDLMAVGAIQAAGEAGRSIPGDLALVGFDDIELASFLQPPLTTIRQPKQEMGRLAVELLLSRIHDRNQPVRRITLPVSLILRESSGTHIMAANTSRTLSV
jgi:LacI family transcriptional regulator